MYVVYIILPLLAVGINIKSRLKFTFNESFCIGVNYNPFQFYSVGCGWSGQDQTTVETLLPEHPRPHLRYRQ